MLEGVARGEPAITPATAARIIDEFAADARRQPAGRPERLTERELEVLQLVTAGQRNKEIAVELGISENTVKFHLKNIVEKLHAQNRAELAARAVREGLVPDRRDCMPRESRRPARADPAPPSHRGRRRGPPLAPRSPCPSRSRAPDPTQSGRRLLSSGTCARDSPDPCSGRAIRTAEASHGLSDPDRGHGLPQLRRLHGRLPGSGPGHDPAAAAGRRGRRRLGRPFDWMMEYPVQVGRVHRLRHLRPRVPGRT